MALKTPIKIQDLQRKLYLRAKREPKFRFHAVYDKVYRKDFLAHAFALCRANRGAPGPDGISFEEIRNGSGPEAMLEDLAAELRVRQYKPGPVRRVYIPKGDGFERPLGIPNIRDRVVQMSTKLVLEPIFEAGFEDSSYGFRPKRSAHDALNEVKKGLEKERMDWVVDADVSKCFDRIPHDKLLKAVAQRVVDGAMLALVKSFLKAPVLDERESGGPRKPGAGTPQGGVISPLLMNIYLHWVDRSFRLMVERGKLKGRIVRYADDIVILSPHRPTRELRWLQEVMKHLGLSLHPEKTRIVHSREESFLFLGHKFMRPWGRRVYLDFAPKAKKRFREKIRESCRLSYLPLKVLIARLNPIIRGTANYFSGTVTKSRSKLDNYVRQKVARWARRKYHRRMPVWSLIRANKLSRKYGLKRLYTPISATSI